MIRVGYHITEKQLSELKVLSNESGLSVAELIRRAIDNYIYRRYDKNI